MQVCPPARGVPLQVSKGAVIPLFENSETCTATGVVPVLWIQQAATWATLTRELVGAGGLRSCPAWAKLASPTSRGHGCGSQRLHVTLLLVMYEHQPVLEIANADGTRSSRHDHHPPSAGPGKAPAASSPRPGRPDPAFILIASVPVVSARRSRPVAPAVKKERSGGVEV